MKMEVELSTGKSSANVGEENTDQNSINGIPEQDFDDVLAINVTKLTWREASPRFNLQFGRASQQYVVQPSNQLARRNPSASDEIARPNAKITGQAMELSYELNDETLSYPGVPIKIGCKKCSIDAAIEVSLGGFEVDLEDEEDPIKSGYIEYNIQRFTEHVEYDLEFNDDLEWEYHLHPHHQAFPIDIPDVLSMNLGASFNAHIWMNWTEAAQLSFGGEVKIPENSKIRINYIKSTYELEGL
jgi:hypothetical protein